MKFEFYCYQLDKNSNQIGQAYFDEVELTGVDASGDPSITVTPYSKEENYDTETGKFTVTYNKIAVSEILFYESDGSTPALSNPYDWFDADIDGDGNVVYTLSENSDSENSRTAYFKIYGLDDDEGGDVYSELISVTQKKYALDYATLPFEFDKGVDDIASTTGLTQSGLGSDYAASPKLKFNDQGDYVILKIKGSLPDELSFDIKGNSLSGTYAFKVQWSKNGTDYTDLATYTSISSSKDTKTIELSSSTYKDLRYIKWIYATKGSAGNVALGNIKVSQQTVAITPSYNKTTYVTTKKLNFSNVDGLKAYVATDAASSGVTMTKVEAAVPENTPLLLIGTAGTAYNVPVVGSATAPETNYLVKGDGSTDMSEVAGYNYILFSDGLFYQCTSGTIATTKAYLHLEEAPSAHALDIIFDEGGEATGITEVTNGQQTKANGQYFNLAGQRVNTNHKGIVIVNGKKYFNK